MKCTSVYVGSMPNYNFELYGTAVYFLGLLGPIILFNTVLAAGHGPRGPEPAQNCRRARVKIIMPEKC